MCLLLTSSGSKPPGITVPSLEQKQYGNVHSSELHFCAKSIGASVGGAGAIKITRNSGGKKFRHE